MSFVNKPLILRQNMTIYKLWLVQFDIDSDCKQLIKQLTIYLCMKRLLIPPEPLKLNKDIFYLSNKTYYINTEGIVFRLRDHQNFVVRKSDLKIGDYSENELFTHTNCNINNLQQHNISSLLLSYKPGYVLEIDFKLSGISTTLIDYHNHPYYNYNTQLTSYHRLFNSKIMFI